MSADETRKETRFAALHLGTIEDAEHHPGRPSSFGCPDCGGVLWELQEGELTRFRCRVGHAWTGEGLMARQEDMLDTALWTALRTLEEHAALTRQLAERQHRAGHERLAARLEQTAIDNESKAAVIRQVLAQPASSSNSTVPPG